MQINLEALIKLHAQLEALKTTLDFMAGACMDAHAANPYHPNHVWVNQMAAAIPRRARLVDDGRETLQRAQAEVN